MRSEFMLDPEITFLNFGSFGATPRQVFEDLLQWQRLLEKEPVQFIAVNGNKYLAESRKALGPYVGCDARDLVYVSNPSYAMNIVARNLPLQKGDEVLSTNLEYGACDRIFRYYCAEKGATFVRQPIKLPIQSKESFLENFLAGITKKTRAIFIGQITSSTALILPVKEIIDVAKKKGIITIIDGAHVPGHIPLNITELGADIYTGACHKWMMSPKGSSFLFVKRELQPLMKPLVVSWGWESDTPSDSSFIDYHQMQGTRDFSAFLAVPASIGFMKKYQWEKVSAACRKMVLDNAPSFAEISGKETLSPLSEQWLGQMFSIPYQTSRPEELQRRLFDQYRIEIPVTRLGDRTFVRFSINAFNTQDDLDKLHLALCELRTEFVK